MEASSQSDRNDVTIARHLAEFVTTLSFQDLPADIVRQAKTLVLDQLACELIGSTMPWVQPALDLVKLTIGAKPESTVVNHGLRLQAADTAFANATFGQACELDDSAFGSAGHIGTATIPAALAMAEREKVNGRQFLTAVVAGYEVMYRVMRSVRPFHDTRGFHSQGIGGPFASAAATGKILGLSVDQMVHALAIAGSHCSGPLEYDQSGGEVKRIHAGLAARGGIHSALLAKFGLTGPPTIIEGKRGFCNIFATESDPASITVGLGTDFNISNVSFKMYPAIGGVHTAIAAVDNLVTAHKLSSRDIARIRVGLPEKVLLHGAGIRQPHDVVGAQFSLAFSLALTVCRRSNDLTLYRNPACWQDPEIVALIDKVEAYAHPEVTGRLDHMALVSMELNDGRKLEAREDYLRGSPKNPASARALEAKVRGMASAVLSPSEIDRLVEVLGDLETIKDISLLPTLLVAPRHRLKVLPPPSQG